MIISILSDTHLEYPNAALRQVFETHCLDAQVLVHCGDLVGEETWSYLNSHPRFYAVQGNCDLPPLRGTLPMLRELEVAGFKLGLAHGWGPRSAVGTIVAEQFPDADIVCYGHTHIRDWQKLKSGAWLLNSGSLFWPRKGAGGLARLHLEPHKDPQVEWISLS